MQIDQAQDDKVLNRILDDPAHMAIINSSTWPVTKGISMLTKMELMQTLIIEDISKSFILPVIMLTSVLTQ